MRLFNYLLVACVLVTLSSCSITEKIIFNEDNSGKFAYEVDGSKMMSMMGSVMKEEDAKKSKKKKNKKEEIANKDIDSTFSLKELFASKKDSIAQLPLEEQEKIKKLERFNVHMIMNQDKGIMNYTMFADFKSIAELQDMTSPLQSLKSLNSNQTIGSQGNLMQDNNLSDYQFDGNVFKKKVHKILADKTGKTKEELKSEEDATEAMKGSMEMIYQQSDFKVVYQFSKTIKKASLPNALYSDDRKTVTVLFSLKDYMENPENLNIEVELEK